MDVAVVYRTTILGGWEAAEESPSGESVQGRCPTSGILQGNHRGMNSRRHLSPQHFSCLDRLGRAAADLYIDGVN